MFKGIASSMFSKAAAVQEELKGKAAVLGKIAKGKTSSNFERFVLTATWPDDNTVDLAFTQVRCSF
jgi:hypothetical protein